MEQISLFGKKSVDNAVKGFSDIAGWTPINPNEVMEVALKEVMKLENPPSPTKAGFIRPSSLTECIRKLAWEFEGVAQESTYDGTPRIGESGSDAHTHIQSYMVAMRKHGIEIDYISISEYLEKFPNPDIEIIDDTLGHTIISTDVTNDLLVYEYVNQDGETKQKEVSLSGYIDRYHSAETLLYNKKTRSRFKADGIIKMNDKYYVLEIKTETQEKYKKHDKTLEPHDKHKLQGTYYANAFGIEDVMFLYENRNNCSFFVTVFHVDKIMSNKVKSIINETLKYGENGWIAPRTQDKMECRYCPFLLRCTEAGDTLPR